MPTLPFMICNIVKLWECSINKQDGNVFQHQPRFILFSLPLNYKITKITKIYEFIKQNQILNINNIV